MYRVETKQENDWIPVRNNNLVVYWTLEEEAQKVCDSLSEENKRVTFHSFEFNL